jgi:stalled ribosome rescue protein Dom34
VKDTPARIEQKFRQMLLRRSGEERLKMGCSMHAAARALATASISQQHRNANGHELKRLMFLRIYGNDFEPEERKRIASALAARNRADVTKRKLRSDAAGAGIVKSSGADVVWERAEKYRQKPKNKPKRSRTPSS